MSPIRMALMGFIDLARSKATDGFQDLPCRQVLAASAIHAGRRNCSSFGNMVSAFTASIAVSLLLTGCLQGR
jgi:hypothetical protein